MPNMPKSTIHCQQCNSQDVIMYNAICKWDVDNQKWVYSENYDPMFQCPDCGNDSTDVTEKEVDMANYTIELTKGEVSTILYHLEEVTKDKSDGEFPEEIQTIFSKLEGAVDAHYEETN